VATPAFPRYAHNDRELGRERKDPRQGLIEAIQDQTILNNSAATTSLRASLGIAGIPNRSANDGTITRFGWKAQNQSRACSQSRNRLPPLPHTRHGARLSQ
jgi:hypothetical protein